MDRRGEEGSWTDELTRGNSVLGKEVDSMDTIEEIQVL